MGPKYYKQRVYELKEWNDKVAKEQELVTGGKSGIESSLPMLLLNYFIINAYEDASCRMAKELGYISSNRDLLQFNTLFKIPERSRILNLVKLGQISDAMDMIKNNFGLEILQEENDQHYAGDVSFSNSTYDSKHVNDNSLLPHTPKDKNTENEDDLHFKLLLLNLIEMIRNNKKKNKGAEVDKDFIISLISYSKEKLAPKALKNESHMKQLELIMTLLLMPQGLKTDLPYDLNKLYSLSLRRKVAALINQKLLKSIYPDITNQTKFPNVLQSPESMTILDHKSSNYKSVLRTDVKPQELQNTTHVVAANMSANATSAGSNSVSDSTSSAISGTASLDNQSGTLSTISASTTNNSLRTNMSSERSGRGSIKDSATTNNTNQLGKNDDILNNQDSNLIPDIRFESKLSQILKLWAWCENEFHQHDYGIPRVQNKA
ncbi:hypothetical protein C6P45_001804 [Maudiozyma exigua]|uniref:CTLH domain-containing protein n=1 Tax=Maudiozyma exigua TaxID=34358 RepID=A0A9P6WD16_MAUEX|nr:hypothetical protein C6P45_001804 [Kazachstania exigua]